MTSIHEANPGFWCEGGCKEKCRPSFVYRCDCGLVICKTCLRTHKCVTKIELTQGQIALVDAADYEYLSRFKWSVNKNGDHYRAARMVGRKIIYMHRLIMNAPNGKDVDHIDGNGLNNQRSNLRVCTHQQNIYNTGSKKGSLSIFKGVSWHKHNKMWQSNIVINGKQKCIGYFRDESDAAKAYDTEALKYHGEFARLNFLDNCENNAD